MIKPITRLTYRTHPSYIQSRHKIWQSVIGLEVHAQIQSESKLFSGAQTNFAAPVNTNVSLFDCAIPGTLPVLNKRCVEAAVLSGLAMNCQIHPVSLFDRKHYFYADLPTGYQITQQNYPIATKGFIDFQVIVKNQPKKMRVHLKQLQLEQDSGKSLHEDHSTYIDLNRAGNPLMEFVFEPDLSDGEEAAALVKELASILFRLGTCSCKMEEGALRIDANVSIHQCNEPLGVRTEIKNIGSIRGVANAVKFEIDRQIGILNAEGGGVITNETRFWDAIIKQTVPMRDKEVKQDYRYMPDPNLPPLFVNVDENKAIDDRYFAANAVKLKNAIPELPEETRTRLQANYGISLIQATILVNDNALLKLFEECSALLRPALCPTVANLIIIDYLKIVNKYNKQPEEMHFSGANLSEIATLLESRKINRNTVEYIIERIAIDGSQSSPSKIIQDNSLTQITDEQELENICLQVLNANEKAVKQYLSGKKKVFKFFLGQVYVESNKRADMPKVVSLLEDILKTYKL